MTNDDRQQRQRRIAQGRASARDLMAEAAAVNRERHADELGNAPADAPPDGWIRTRTGLRRAPVHI